MRTNFPANSIGTRSESSTHHAPPATHRGHYAHAIAPDRSGDILQRPWPRTRLWKLLAITLDSPVIRAIVAALAVYGVWYGAFNTIAQSMSDSTGVSTLICGGLVQGAIAGHLVTGNARGILFGALSGGAFGLIGDVTSGWMGIGKWMGRSVIQGLAAGTLNTLQGGSFTSAFVGTALGGLAITTEAGAVLLRIGNWL